MAMVSSMQGSLRKGVKTAANVAFARSPNDPTGEWTTLEALGLEHPERAPYVASPWWVLRGQLPLSDLGTEDVFVDFGCGKGRIVLDAARRYRFAEVIGVELSPDLSAVARDLLAQDRSRFRARSVRIETVDATRFAIPDTMTHVFMFNPFRGDTFATVVANIIASVDRTPRPVKLIYVNPEEHDALMATGRFRLESRFRTTRLVAPTSVATYVLR
jgi:SAM-dependent methyltransferase